MNYTASVNKTLASAFGFELKILDIQHETWKGDKTPEFQRVVFERGDAVGVLLFDRATEEFILVEQFRPGVAANQNTGKSDSPWVIEVVAGSMDEVGESPEVTARREVSEEAPGCEIVDIDHVSSVYLSPGACSEKKHLFIATVDSFDAGDFGGLADHQEDIKVIRVNPHKAMRMIETGEINTAAAIMLIQFFMLRTQQNMF